MGPGRNERCGPEAGEWPRRVHDALTAARDHAGGDGDRGPDAADLSGGQTDADPAKPARRLAASGLPMRDMRLEPNRDHPADTDLCFERGQYVDRVRLTDADRHMLRALLTVHEEPAALRVRARAAGYRLADEDHRLAYQDEAGAREFLQDLLAQRLADEAAAPDSVREMRATHETQAVRDVIAMLEGK